MAGGFQAGDRVRLLEGGPVMTVKGYKSGRVVCSWYQTRKGWKQKTFDEATVRRVGRSRIATAEG